MRKVGAGIPAALVLVLGLAAPVAADPITLIIGTFSFDEFIPPDGSAPGTNAFNIVNYTGLNALLDPNAAVELTFSNLVVTLTDALGQDEVIEIDSLGPGALLDPFTFAPLFTLQRPDTALFASAMLEGIVSLGSFLLPDGRLFTPNSSAFSALLLPSAGSFLVPFDIVGIELAGDAAPVQSVPEASTLILICSGLSLLYRSRRQLHAVKS